METEEPLAHQQEQEPSQPIPEIVEPTSELQTEQEQDPTARKASQIGYQPSPSLMKSTKARLYDSKELIASKNRVKHEDDIWWEVRKSEKTLDTVLEKEKDSIPKIGAISKLHVPTTAYVKGTREKFPIETIISPTKPLLTQKGHSPAHDQPPVAPKTARINLDSPLLKPTKAAVVCQWNPIAPPPAPTPLTLAAAESGPKNVPSKLHKDTIAASAQKWKSKEQIQLEQQEKDLQAKEASASAVKVKSTSERLVKFNASMQSKTVSKLKKNEADPREKGWNDKHVKGAIPELEKVFPSKKLDSGEIPASKPELNKTEITVEDNIENITNNVLE